MDRRAKRKTGAWVAATAAAVAVLGMSGRASADTTTLKIGTLAPANSPWGTVFKVWQKGIKDRTGGAVEIQFFWSGSQGDETAMVGKIRGGQLDGAAITATGLGEIYKQVTALQTPGVFASWAKLDAARNKMKGRFDKQFLDAGFKNLGWGDVGAAHMMTKGFEVRTPKQLQGKLCYAIKGDPVAPMLYSLLNINYAKVTVPEITTGLTSGTINVVNSPPLAAEQLQFAPQLTHINTLVSGYAIGALVMSARKFDHPGPNNGPMVKGDLPADVQKALEETGAVAASALTTTIRNADDAAYTRLAVGYPDKKIPPRMTAYTPTPAEQEEWKKLFADVRGRLKGTAFQADVVDEIEGAAK